MIKKREIEAYGGILRKVEGKKLVFEVARGTGELKDLVEYEEWDLDNCIVEVMNDFWDDLIGLKVGLVKGKHDKPTIQLCKISDLILRP